MKITLEQAIANINAAIGQYKGTRDEHLTLQESLKVLTEAAAPKEAEAPKE